MTRARHLSIIHIVFVFLILLAGCARSTVSDAVALTQNAATVIFSARQTQLPTITPTRTKRPTWTPIVFPSPPTPTPIWTPLPTVSNSEAALLIQEWLEGSIDCQLPCWGGITPGVTTWQEAKQILGAIANIGIVEEKVPCNFGLCNVLYWHSLYGKDISGSLSSQYFDGLIRAISIEGFQILPLDRILSQYGSPEKVFLSWGPRGGWERPDDLYLDLILTYPNYKYILKYTWNASIVRENIVGCAQEARIYLSVTDLVASYWTDDLIKASIHGEQYLDEMSIWPLEEVTDLTISEFYDMYKSIDGSECIIIPLMQK